MDRGFVDRGFVDRGFVDRGFVDRGFVDRGIRSVSERNCFIIGQEAVADLWKGDFLGR